MPQLDSWPGVNRQLKTIQRNKAFPATSRHPPRRSALIFLMKNIHLSPEQIEQYHEHGYLLLGKVLTDAQVAAMQA